MLLIILINVNEKDDGSGGCVLSACLSFCSSAFNLLLIMIEGGTETRVMVENYDPVCVLLIYY